MYLNGAIESIHSNGLISYQSNPSYADGRPKGAVHTTNVHDRDNETDRDSSNEENESDDETVIGRILFVNRVAVIVLVAPTVKLMRFYDLWDLWY
jgi:hypothetical protein